MLVTISITHLLPLVSLEAAQGITLEDITRTHFFQSKLDQEAMEEGGLV